MKAEWRLLALLVASAGALLWAVPFAWMAVAALRPGVPADIATLTPAGPFSLSNFQEAWKSGNFPLWYLNTIIVCGGILAVQLVTVTAAGYAFARLTSPRPLAHSSCARPFARYRATTRKRQCSKALRSRR